MKSDTSVNNREPRAAHTNAGNMPELEEAVGWLNSVPLGRDALRGKVVLVDF